MWQVQNFKDDNTKKWLVIHLHAGCFMANCYQDDDRCAWTTWGMQCLANAMYAVMYSIVMNLIQCWHNI